MSRVSSKAMDHPLMAFDPTALLVAQSGGREEGFHVWMCVVSFQPRDESQRV